MKPMNKICVLAMVSTVSLGIPSAQSGPKEKCLILFEEFTNSLEKLTNEAKKFDENDLTAHCAWMRNSFQKNFAEGLAKIKSSPDCNKIKPVIAKTLTDLEQNAKDQEKVLATECAQVK